MAESTVQTGAPEPYLQPYLRAARQHGGGFSSLLWATPGSQRVRFDAICRICELTGKSILDVGCGRADFRAYLLENRIPVADYTGIEAVEDLAREAESRGYTNSRILRADFVREPARLFVGADVVVFSGSLNTIDDADFYQTLSRAIDATAQAVVFNFLSNPSLAGRDYLRWRRTEHVLGFLKSLPVDVQTLTDYLHGDTTVAVVKHSDPSTFEP